MTPLNLLEKVINACFQFIPRKTPTPSEMQAMHLIAHRGAHNPKKGILENTHPAFQKAEELGMWGIEFDIHQTHDLQWVVHHDKTLKRLWKKEEAIEDCDWAQLRSLAPQIPTLDSVVQSYGKKMHLFIELKHLPKDANALETCLKPLTPGIDYHLIALEASILRALNTFPSEACLLVSSHKNTSQFVNLCIEEGYGGVLGHYLLLNKTKINRLKQHKKMAGVGFIGSKNALYRALNLGIHEVFTNQAESLTKKKPA